MILKKSQDNTKSKKRTRTVMAAELSSLRIKRRRLLMTIGHLEKAHLRKMVEAQSSSSGEEAVRLCKDSVEDFKSVLAMKKVVKKVEDEISGTTK